MLTVQTLASRLNQEVIDGLIKNAVAVPADKLEWQPLDTGRTVLNQVAECALITKYISVMLNTRALPEFSNESYSAQLAALDTIDKAVSELKSAASELKASMESFPTDQLENTLTLPWFAEPQTFASIMFIPYWNNTYHIGQICYIQTLFGDKETH